MYELSREMGTCSPGGGYVAAPTDELEIDLERLKEIIEEEGFDIKFSSNLMLTITISPDKIDISFYKSGKILFKTYKENKVKSLLDRFKPLVKKAKRN